MSVADQLSAWIIKNKDKKGTPEFEKVSNALREVLGQQQAASSRPTGPDPEVPVLGAPVQPGIPREEPVFTPVEYLKGAGEAALTGLSASTAGLLGQAGGFLGQYAREAYEGTLGSQEAALRIQDAAMRRGQQLTYPTTSPAGQYLLGKVGELTEPLAALDPVVSGQLNTVLTSAQKAADIRMPGRMVGERKTPTPGQQAILDKKDDLLAAQRLDIPVMRSDVVEPGPTGEFMQKFTGGLRKTQQKARVDAVRQTLQDAGAIEVANASDKVLKDLLKTRESFINKYVAEKQEVIDRLSETTYIKEAGKQGFKSTATVPMANLNKYIDDQLYGKRDLVRLAEQGDADAAAMVRELTDLQASFTNNTRLSDIEFKRKMLGETYSSEAVKDGKIKPTSKSIIDNAYGPIVEDMGAHIEKIGSKEDRLKWQRANRNLKAGIDDLKDRAFAKMVKNDEVDPDTINKLLLSKNTPKIKMLYKNLSEDGRRNADRLFLSQAYEIAKTPDGAIDPDKFNKFLNTHSKVIDFMGSGTRDEVRGLNKALQLTAKASKSVSGPSAVTSDMLGFGVWAAKRLAAIAGGTFVAGRMESPRRLRAAFQNLGKAPPGSRAERMAINGLNAAIIAENNRLAQEAQRQQQQAR